MELIQSETFRHWLNSLKDRQARARIQARLDRLALGNPGDARPLRDGVSELRIDYGPGYRVYYTRRGEVLYLLLLGGDKSSQKRDIQRAIDMAHELGKE